MKTIRILIYLFLAASAGFAQAQEASGPLSNKVPIVVRPSLHTGFSYAKQWGSSTWITPLFSADLSERFTLTAGISIITADRYLAVPESGRGEVETEVRLKKKRSTSAWFYAEGTYLVNPRLVVSGSILREMTGSGYGLMPEQITSLGMAYQLSRRVTIGMQITHTQGNDSYYSVPGYPVPFYPMPGSYMNSY